MNIAMVGADSMCLSLMDLIERHTFREISPRVVAVADKNNEAPGLARGREAGLFVTNDYNDFFSRDNIDLIVELTGDQEVYNDILRKKKKEVSVVGRHAVVFFWELYAFSLVQRETEKELEETRNIYSVMINELLQEEVMVIGSDYRVLDINETHLKKLGLSREEAVGRFCYEITHHQDTPCSGEEHPCPLIKTLETHKPFQTTHIHLDNFKKEHYYAISCYPFLDKGEVVGAIELSRDISKEISIQKVLMRQEKMASIGRLAAGVAHEINNPLTTILTGAMLLQEDTDRSDPVYPELGTIVNETMRCRKIVSSLLDFARQKEPVKKMYDTNNIISDSIVLTRKQAAFNDVVMEDNLAVDLPQLNIDKDQLQQALLNLSLNAIEASKAGGKVTISSRFLPKEKVVQIKVKDSGSGIESDDLNKIFDPFFTTKENGTGLGLSITHGIIEQNGGTIDVESVIDQGTTFTIRLPLAQGDSNAS